MCLAARLGLRTWEGDAVARRSAEAVDGRVTRTLRSRLAICDACLDLVQEGVLQPGADQIAERAGVSRRSIESCVRRRHPKSRAC